MATFDAHGKAQLLPDRYLPESYREWGIEILDWQTQCSMQTTESGNHCKLRKLFTGAGCEPDAIASVEERWALMTTPERFDKNIIRLHCQKNGFAKVLEYL